MGIMPICEQETTVFPADLLQMPEALAGAGPGEEPRQWWVLYTKSRQEKSLARDLLQYQIPFYLPLVRANKVYRKWKVSTYTPLFSGYVFLFGSHEERGRSLTTNRLSRILPVEDGDSLSHDLRQLQLLIASGAPLTLEGRLAPGTRVRVRRGLLEGLEGTVLERRGQTRLLVSVNFLQQGASVDIDDFMLERLDHTPLVGRNLPR
jgi:transcription antitermination factor NusG